MYTHRSSQIYLKIDKGSVPEKGSILAYSSKDLGSMMAGTVWWQVAGDGGWGRMLGAHTLNCKHEAESELKVG